MPDYIQSRAMRGLAASFVLLLLIPSKQVQAQVNSSTVTGEVIDSTGPRVPNAKVTVINQATGVRVDTLTTSSGSYTVAYMISGVYRIEVAGAGFATKVAENAQVGNNATVRVDVTLETGRAEITVQVDGSVAALETDDTSVKTSIDARMIDALPNISQNPLLYATLQPGVAAEKTAHYTQGTDSFGVGPHARRTLSLISINGGLGFTTDIQLDGAFPSWPTTTDWGHLGETGEAWG